MGACLGKAVCPKEVSVKELPPASADAHREFLRAIRYGHLAEVQMCILQRSVDPHLSLNSIGSQLPFVTAVISACWLGHEDIVRYLLPLEPRDPRRIPLLRDFAIGCQMLPIPYIEIFVSHFGSSIVTDSVHYNTNKDSSGNQEASLMTPIHHACIRGNLRLIQFLLRHGANMERPALSNQSTPLHCLAVAAASKRHQDRSSSSSSDQDGDILSVLDWIIREPDYSKYLFLENRFGKSVLEAVLFHTTQLDVIRTCIVWLCHGHDTVLGGCAARRH